MSRARLQLMIDKLKIEVDNDRVNNDWASTFICDMYNKSKIDHYTFSTKQIDRIEELFERY